jgi:hypothetical protein
MAIKVSGSTIIDDSRNIVNAGVVTTASADIGYGAVGINSTGINVTGVVTATSLSMGGQILSTLGVGIRTEGSISGTGATILDFRGSGISTVTVSSGIATINISGGGGGFSPINFILS